MREMSTGGSTFSKLNYSISAALNYVQYIHAVVSSIDGYCFVARRRSAISLSSTSIPPAACLLPFYAEH